MKRRRKHVKLSFCFYPRNIASQKAPLKPCVRISRQELPKVEALMACLISISFGFPISTSHNFSEEIYPRKLSPGRLSSYSTCRSATKLSASCRFNKGLSSINKRFWHDLLTPLRHHFEIVSLHSNVDSCCTQMILAGYWVGPDIEDGWGYIEAFVNLSI